MNINEECRVINDEKALCKIILFLNAVQFAELAAYANNDRHLTKAYLLDGIRKEYLKDEKTI